MAKRTRWTPVLSCEPAPRAISHRMRSIPTFSLAASLFLGAWLLPFASATSQRRAYLGFDANDYPGDDALPILRKTFAFAGFWLGPPPGEKRNTWLGKRPVLESRGFGFLVLYDGRDSRKLKSVADAHQKG